MFASCNSLKELKLTEEKFKTNNVTNMQYMFYNCWALPTLDVTGFKTGNVTDMQYMFCNCQASFNIGCFGI